MDYRLEGLRKMTSAELDAALKSIPAEATHLDLNFHALGKRTTPEIVRFIAAIPAHITELDLRCNEFDLKTDAELTTIFNALPHNISALYFGGNGLINKIGKDLNGILKALPAHIKSINYDVVPPSFLRTQPKSPCTINVDEFKTKYAKIQTSLMPHLLHMKAKVKKLENREYGTGRWWAAAQVVRDFASLKDKYVIGLIDYPEFKKESLAAIQIARPDLEKHHGWKEVLGNLALCILGLGVGYALVCAYRGGFFKFNTDSENILNKIQQNVDTISPTL